MGHLPYRRRCVLVLLAVWAAQHCAYVRAFESKTKRMTRLSQLWPLPSRPTNASSRHCLTNGRTLHYQPRRRVIRRRRRGWRIGSFPDVTLIVRAFADVACALGHPVPGVADAHIPLHTLVWSTSIHVQRIPWAPPIWTVAAYISSPTGLAACLRGTCRFHTRQP